MVSKHSLDCIPLIFNMTKVFGLFLFLLESIELVNYIHPLIIQIDNDNNPLVITSDEDFDQLKNNSWTNITVNKDILETMKDELILNDYPHVQCIYIKKNSFTRISSLTISNLPELRSVIVERDCFSDTTSVVLSSIF